MYNEFEDRGVFFATEEDIPALVDMGEAFLNLTTISDLVECDKASIHITLNELIKIPNCILLVLKEEGEVVGAIGALLYPFYFNFKYKTGQELFFWINPEHRGKGKYLLDAVEYYAKEQGATSFSMVSLEGYRPEAVGALYKRRGYRPTEHAYVKGL